MKILMTSGGITNKSLAAALKKLVGEKMRIAFIPTAANVEDGDKDWLIRNYNECEMLGSVDIVDISSLDKEVWLPRLKKSNVIFVGGGNTYYLMRWILKSGLSKELPNLLKDRVYVGISAGSIVTNPDLALTTSKIIYREDLDETKNMEALKYVDFYIRPHLNSPHFPKVRDKYLKEDSKKANGDVYALDDASGVIFDNGKIEIVSEGKWIKYSN